MHSDAQLKCQSLWYTEATRQKSIKAAAEHFLTP